MPAVFHAVLFPSHPTHAAMDTLFMTISRYELIMRIFLITLNASTQMDGKSGHKSCGWWRRSDTVFMIRRIFKLQWKMSLLSWPRSTEKQEKFTIIKNRARKGILIPRGFSREGLNYWESLLTNREMNFKSLLDLMKSGAEEAKAAREIT